MAVAVHVVGGFLGAGKTTAVLGLLRGPLAGDKVAVVVNDFGTAAVDEATVGEGTVSIAEIRGGCVCCTAPEGFVGAVGRLLDEEQPDRIVVEPTGLARPADLIDTLRRAPYADRLDLRPLIVLVDPEQLAGSHRETLEDQAVAADVLVANRTDLASEEALEAYREWAAGLWPGPMAVVETVNGELPASVLTWPEGKGPRATGERAFEGDHDHDHEGHDHDHDDHGAVHGFRVSTWTWGPETVFSRRRLLAALDDLVARPEMARLKGIFRTDEGWTRLELAGGTRHEGTTDWRRDSRVDGIRSAGAEDPVGETLAGAVLTEAEQAAAAESVELGLPDGSAKRFDRSALAALPGGVPDVSGLLPGREGEAARVDALLDAVGAEAGLQAVVVAADGYTTPPVPADALRSGLLLHSLDGGPLPANKGGPIRLMIPGDAGPGGPCANVKAVVRIALRPS